MKHAHSVAVIITAKDAAATAAKAIRSALAQNAVREVMFVDDGSTDETANIAASNDDGSGRLKIIRLEHNRGPSFGRNLAIEATNSPFLCILDADDFMTCERLDHLFDAGGDDWDLLADDLLFIDRPDGTEPVDRLFPADFRLPRMLSFSDFVAGNLSRKGRYRREFGFLKPLIRRSFLQVHGIRYDERVRLGEDMLYYSACLAAGARFKLVPACGYFSVQSPNSLSGMHRTEDLANLHQASVEFEKELEPQAREAGHFADFTRSVGRRLSVRRALDAKRSGGWPGFLFHIQSDRKNAAYVLNQLVRAKLFSQVKRLKPNG